MAENSPNLAKDIFLYSQETEQTPKDELKEICAETYHSKSANETHNQWKNN